MTLKDRIQSGEFIVCGELGPPQSANGDVIRKKSVHFKDRVHGVNITDNQTAIVRLSSIASGKILLDEGVEPIIQMTCRDRNRIAIQSDLLGAWALGLRNVLCLTGDYQKFGNHPEARPVFDMDSIQLILTVANLNKGYFLSGEAMKTPPDFCIGAAANPFADPFEMRLLRLDKKIRAGAHFIQTQPVFDLEKFTRYMEEAVKLGLHEKTAILAGIMPVKSVNTLLHMENVPGMRIDAKLVDRMRNAKDPREEGVRIAVEMIAAVKAIPGVRGIHIMPVMWESIVPDLLAEAGLTHPAEIPVA